MTTVILLGVFAVLLALQFLLVTSALWWVTPRLSTAERSWGRCALAAIALFVVGIPPAILNRLSEPNPSAPFVITALTSIGLGVFAVSRLLRMPPGKASLAWLAAMAASLPLLAMVAFAVRPFIFEAYAQSTNSMAPTVLGDHWTGSCPECGARTYCTAESEGHAMEGEPLMICEHELRAYNVAPNSRQVTSADRFFVSKLLKPARWDLVTYRYPADPSTIYLGRLVGLPGDTLTIDDGSVWINGDRLIPPEEFSGLYHLNKLDDIPGLSIQMWGVPNQPAELGADEYFVLGDFSARSRDSRLWTESIDGRPPYALPAANIVGVLTHIYWPLDRLRVFR